MSLPLETKVRYGLMTRMWDTAATRHVAGMLDRLDMDSLWVGDHIAFTMPTVDPLMQLLQAATATTVLGVPQAVGWAVGALVLSGLVVVLLLLPVELTDRPAPGDAPPGG